MAQWDDYIEKHASRTGIDPTWLRKIMRVESGGNPNNKTGSYKGLFQLSNREFTANGGSGNIYDPEQNTMAAANKISKEKLRFEQKYGRQATLADIYMIHQQGEAGYGTHMDNPEGVAWKNVRRYYNSDTVAKAAIWGNMTPAMKAKYGTVDNVKSEDFTQNWATRIEGGTEGNVSRGRPGVQWHRSRGDQAEIEAYDKAMEKPAKDVPDFTPPRVETPSVSAPESPSISLGRIQPTQPLPGYKGL